MALVRKIDSSDTDLRLAWETTTLGVLPTSPAPTWYPQEPNEYGDFGGEYTTVARRPITADAQLKKGVVTDENAPGQFQEDLTQTNLGEKIEAFLYATYRRKPETVATGTTTTQFNVTGVPNPGQDFLANDLLFASGFDATNNNGLFRATIDGSGGVITATGQGLTASSLQDGYVTMVGHQFASGGLAVEIVNGLPNLVVPSGGKDLTQLGLVPGEIIFIGDGSDAAFSFAIEANTTFARVQSIADDRIILDKAEFDMAADVGTGKTIRVFFGRVCKNEATKALIVRKTATIERQLGAPDDSAPTTYQAQYLTGSVANVCTISGDATDKVVVDYEFVCQRQVPVTAAEGLWAGDRPDVVEADAFSVSSDVREHGIHVVDPEDANPTPLFVFCQDMEISIDNGVTGNKAVSFLGSFDMSRGHITCMWNATAYFSTVESLLAVKNNRDVTVWSILAKANAGMAFDMPLVTVSSDFPDVPVDEAITLPIEATGAKGTKVHANYTHTFMSVFFDYLPDVAMPVQE